jgi:hypothetical protein
MKANKRLVIRAADAAVDSPPPPQFQSHKRRKKEKAASLSDTRRFPVVFFSAPRVARKTDRATSNKQQTTNLVLPTRARARFFSQPPKKYLLTTVAFFFFSTAPLVKTQMRFKYLRKTKYFFSQMAFWIFRLKVFRHGVFNSPRQETPKITQQVILKKVKRRQAGTYKPTPLPSSFLLPPSSGLENKMGGGGA